MINLEITLIDDHNLNIDTLNKAINRILWTVGADYVDNFKKIDNNIVFNVKGGTNIKVYEIEELCQFINNTEHKGQVLASAFISDRAYNNNERIKDNERVNY